MNIERNGNGNIQQNERGFYTVLVRTNPPFKEIGIQNVAVTDSATTDVGEVKLLQ